MAELPDLPEPWADTIHGWAFTEDQMRAYARAAVEQAANWMPIESAPRDGTEFDVFCTSDLNGDDGGYRISGVWWSRVDSRWRAHGDLGLQWAHQPTHWRPIPASPARDTAGER